MNSVKTLILLAALTALLVWAGDAMGGSNGAIMALFFAGFMNFFAYWFSDKMVLKMYRAKEVHPGEDPQLYNMVKGLAMKADLPVPKVYEIPQESPNAFATGRNPKNAAVAVTTGIRRILTDEELAGVIGHELAHVRNRDILVSTIAATIAGAISYLAWMAQWAAIFGGGRGSDRGGGNIFGLLFMMIVAPLAAMIIQMAISRSREFGADKGGAEICGNPVFLANALRKLEAASKGIPMRVNEATTEATAHMFIVNPLRGGGLVKIFSTHPPIGERVRRLEEMAGIR
jgi:heat shock protein HtpX